MVEQKRREKTVNLNGDALEVTEKFCYFSDLLSADGRVYDSVVPGIRV